MNTRDGVALASDLLRLRRSQWYPRERLLELQRRRLADQLQFARGSVPFYRHAWPPDPLARLQAGRFADLPLIRREQIQADPRSFLSELGDASTWHTSLTSGSTGRPLESYFDRDCWRRVKYALKLRRLFACGWKPGNRLIVVEAVPARERRRYANAHSLPAERELAWLLGSRELLSLFDPPESHIEFYQSYRPQFIYAPPSYLASLARLWTAEQRERVPLRALMTSGEWMHPAARERIADAFEAPILDVYGSTEFKEVAWQCPEQRALHINMESVLVEVVDEQGVPVPIGHPGEIVLTTLQNRAMPMVRYATSDRGILSDALCPCGRESLSLESIEGRTVDEIRLAGGRSVSPYALTTALESCADLAQYRVVQEGASMLSVEASYVGSREHREVERRILRALRGVVGTAPEIRVTFRDRLTQEPSGKCRPVSVHVPRSHAAHAAKPAPQPHDAPTPDHP